MKRGLEYVGLLLFMAVAFATVTLSTSTTIVKEANFNTSASPFWVGQATGGGTASSGSMPQSRHVVVLFEENHPYSDVFPNGMPYVVNLSQNTYAYGTNYTATHGGSLSDYLDVSSGSAETSFGCNGGGCTHPITSDNIFRELNNAGLTWKVYMDGLPSTGFMGLTASSGAGTYYKRHNPAPWYSDIINSVAMQQRIVPWSQFAVDVNANALPNYAFISPSGAHDAHDGTVAAADSWFQANMGVLLNSSYFKPTGDGVLLVTFDENGGGTNNPAIPVWFSAWGPLVKHGVVTNAYNHYDLGRTVYDLLGLKNYPGQIASGHDMIQFFTSTSIIGSTALGPYPDTRAGVLTKDYELASVNNVSRVSPKKMMYTGFNGKIMVAYMVWFFNQSGCSNSNAGIGSWGISRRTCYGSHIDNGYSSNDPAFVSKDMNELQARGFDGPIITWEGVYFNGTRTPKHEDEATQLIAANLQNRCVAGVCPMFFVIQEDNTALIFSTGFAAAAGPVNSNGVFQPHSLASITISNSADEANVLAKLKDDICYANKFYFQNPAYLRIGGQPVWQMFVTEQGILTGGAPSWQDMWTQLGSFVNSLGTNCPAFSGVYGGAPSNNALIMLNGTGASHDGITVGPGNAIDGQYLWDNQSATQGVAGQTQNVTTALSSQSNYINNMHNVPLSMHFGAAWPGFDDQLAGWSPNGGGCGVGTYCTTSGRIQDRACGNTWVNSFLGMNSTYSVNRQLPFVQVVTWNDFDEGTVIQPGIDNCYVLAASVSGSIVSWQLTATNSAASLNTIDHMTIYASTDNSNLGVVADNLTPAISGTFDISKGNITPGQYTFYVKAVGKNSIVNHFASTNGTVNVTVTGTGSAVGNPGNPPGPPFVSPFPSYRDGASAYIKQSQLADNAIKTGTTIIPHDANIAAIGWTQDRAQLPNVVNYMKWYVGKLNTVSDVWGNTLFTIYDYNISGGATGTCVGSPTCTAQATDNYAATFLSLAWALFNTGDAPSQAYVRSISTTLDNIGTHCLLNQQQADGLIWYLPGTFGQIKKLVNNSEDYRGLADMANLEKIAFNNPTRSGVYNTAATSMLTGIASLYTPTMQTWVTQKNATGVVTFPNLRNWVDMMSQLYPVVDGVVLPGDIKAQRAYGQLNTFWPTWPNLTFQSDGTDIGAKPWVFVGQASAVMGDQARVSGFLSAINTVYVLSQFPAPFTTFDGGYTISASNRALSIALGNFKPISISVSGASPNSTGNVNTPGRKKQVGIVIVGDQ